jgi:hypothetical protein
VRSMPFSQCSQIGAKTVPKFTSSHKFAAHPPSELFGYERQPLRLVLLATMTNSRLHAQRSLRRGGRSVSLQCWCGSLLGLLRGQESCVILWSYFGQLAHRLRPGHVINAASCVKMRWSAHLQVLQPVHYLHVVDLVAHLHQADSRV